jgi:hypothetical protein
MNRIVLAFTAATLLGLVACGGGGGGATGTGSTGSGNQGVGSGGGTTTGLTYVDPANIQGQFALVLDTAASTASTLVLDLVGPATSPATPAVGVTFGFNVDTSRAAWSTTPVVNGTLFTLGTGVQLARSWVNGPTLQGIVSNKGLAAQVGDIGNGVIAKIELTPVPGAATGLVSLVDNGLGTVLDSSGTPYPVQVLVGTLTLN